MARVADEKRTANEEVARLVPDMGVDTMAIQIDNHGSVSLSMPRAVWQRDPSGAAAAIWKDMTEEQKKTGKTQLVAALAAMSDEDAAAAIAAVPASDRSALEAMTAKARHKKELQPSQTQPLGIGKTKKLLWGLATLSAHQMKEHFFGVLVRAPLAHAVVASCMGYGRKVMVHRSHEQTTHRLLPR
jgi:hypothetical protein